MSNIYQIQDEVLSATNALSDLLDADEPNAVEIQTALDALIASESELNNKAISYAYVIKSDEQIIDSIDAEIERLNKLKSRKIAKTDHLKNTLVLAMQRFNIDSVSSDTLTVGVRQSPNSVQVTNLDIVPDRFKRTTTTVDVDKVAIKKALKLNPSRVIGGISLTSRTILRIK